METHSRAKNIGTRDRHHGAQDKNNGGGVGTAPPLAVAGLWPYLRKQRGVAACRLH